MEENQQANSGGAERSRRRTTAEAMAAKQRDISVSEFFAKNRHLLGFDNPRKALLTAVKEAVDNSLDACEEAGIVPEIWVHIETTGRKSLQGRRAGQRAGHRQEADPADLREAALRVEVSSPADEPRSAGNRHQRGGHVRHAHDGQAGQDHFDDIAKEAGALLRNPDRHEAEPAGDHQRPGRRRRDSCRREGPAVHHRSRHRMGVALSPAADASPEQAANTSRVHSGTRVTIELEGRYQRGRGSVDEYLEQTAIANPHVTIHYIDPDGNGRTFWRSTTQLPAEPQEIKPHPYGIELGQLVTMLKDSGGGTMAQFLTTSFSRVSPALRKRSAKLQRSARAPIPNASAARKPTRCTRRFRIRRSPRRRPTASRRSENR